MHCSFILIFLSHDRVQSSKEKDSGSQTSQEQIEWNVPMPNFEVRVNMSIHSPAGN
jgi:hypothetical protein